MKRMKEVGPSGCCLALLPSCFLFRLHLGISDAEAKMSQCCSDLLFGHSQSVGTGTQVQDIPPIFCFPEPAA